MFTIAEEKIRRAIKFLKKDINDDWYADLQHYADLHSDIPKITQAINQKIKQGRGVYHAHKPSLFNIPKANGGFRYTLELSPIDRLAFHLFGLELIDLLDRSLPFNILSNRKSLDRETLFKHTIEQWNKFQNYTRICGKEKYIIETDLSNYFDNIDIGKLRSELINAASESKLSSDDFLRCMYLIESIIAILRVISFDGTRGLPQNRDISSFLANIYMRPLDARLKQYTYFRYVDDIRIIAESKPSVNQIMLIMVETLREYGLSLNSSKTKILEPGSYEHDKFIHDHDFEAKKLDCMLNSGKKKLVLDSFNTIYQKTLELLDQKKISDRKFRFLSNRLITFLNAKDINIPQTFKNEIAAKLIGAINNQPDCAAEICSLAHAIGPNRKLQNSLVDWATDPNNLTFEWAVYSVIKTLIQENCKSTKLYSFCTNQLKNPSSSDPIRGISSVLLNTRATRTIVTQISKNNSHFLQRHFLIALSNEKPEILFKMKIATHILDDYKGSHSQLHRTSKSKEFKLIKPSERLPQRILIKELRNYV